MLHLHKRLSSKIGGNREAYSFYSTKLKVCTLAALFNTLVH